MPIPDASSNTLEAGDVLDVVYDVALDPARYDELSDAWDAKLWPQISEGANAEMETRVQSHFRRAEEILDRIGGDPHKAEIPEIARYVEDIASAAAFVFDRNLQIAATNAIGADLLSAKVGARIADLPIMKADLDSFLTHNRALLEQDDATHALVRVRRQTGERLIVFQLRPLRTKSGETYVAAISSDIQWPDTYRDTLSNAFGLSAAESDIVRLIVDCKSVGEIAEMRGRSVGTVRNQIKSILAKTSSRSQIELVRLVMSIMVVSATEADRSAAKGKLPPADQRFVTGADGRRLEYLILGDPDGAPVFYLQTELGLSRLPVFIEAEARQRGIRVISPIRAGFGQSDPVPKGKEFGVQVAEDLLTVMDHEGMGSLPVISIAADNGFAAHMHIRRPGSVAAIIATSGCFPFINDEQAARQQPLHRLVHSTARYFPKLLPFVAKASFKFVRKRGKDKMVELMFAKSPADLEVFKNPDVRDAVLEGSDVALSDRHSAHEAFIQQCLSYHDPDQLTLLPAIEGEVPYHSMNGLKDPSAHADTVAENQIRYPWIDFHIYPDAGQWLFFQYPNDVFDVVEPYLQR